MRQTILILILLISAIHARGQTISKNDSLYLIALEKYAVEIDSFYSKYSYDNRNYSTIYLEQTDLLKRLPDELKGHKLTILTPENWKEVYKRNNNKLFHVKMFPLEIEDEFLVISLTPYHGELKKGNNLELGLSSWTKVYFKQDCNSGKWSYYKTENGGI